jgi:hypothetical protein
MSNIETSVTRLLVATKQLIETLTAWSRRQATETDVSDVYVRLGNEFNVARTSFERAGIEMGYSSRYIRPDTGIYPKYQLNYVKSSKHVLLVTPVPAY